jgi:hypothetical protein
MAALIRFALSNFTLTFLVLGLVATVVMLLRAPKPLTAPTVVEALFEPFLLFSIGFSFFYNFIVHNYFGDMAARFIGWPNSPFQAEVGYASLGFAAVGILARRRSFDLRLAAIVGPSIFLLGAGLGHIRQIMLTNNHAPGNAGWVLYSDFVIPVIGLLLLWMQHHYQRSS